jgi:hypothetical protein
MAQDQVIVPLAGGKATIPREEANGKISFELEIQENDVRSRQFACHLTLRNDTQDSIDITGLNYRLGTGVKIERVSNTSSEDSKEEYDRLKSDVKYLLTAMYISSSSEYRTEYFGKFLQGMREAFTFQNMLVVYYYIITMRFKTFARMINRRFERMDFPITSAATAEDILKGLEAKGIAPPAVTNVLTAKIGRMAAIEMIDQNFVRPEYIAQILPYEEFERVYILKATRHFSSIASYTVAFDVKLAWAGVLVALATFSGS